MESLFWPNVLDILKLMEPRKEQFIRHKVLLQRVPSSAAWHVPGAAIVLGVGVTTPVNNARVGSVLPPADSTQKTSRIRGLMSPLMARPPIRGSSRRQNHPRSAGETILVAKDGKHWARLVPLDSEGRTSAWRYPCLKQLCVQPQLLGRRHERRIQAAEGGATSAGDGQVQGIGRSQGRGPAAQAGVGVAEVLRLEFQHQQARRQAALKP